MTKRWFDQYTDRPAAQKEKPMNKDYSGKYSANLRLAARITQIVFWQMSSRLELTEAEIGQAADAVFGEDSDVGDMCDIDNALLGDDHGPGKTSPFLVIVEQVERTCDDYLDEVGVPDAHAE